MCANLVTKSGIAKKIPTVARKKNKSEDVKNHSRHVECRVNFFPSRLSSVVKKVKIFWDSYMEKYSVNCPLKIFLKFRKSKK